MPPLARRSVIQLAVFAVVAIFGAVVMVFGYIRVPEMLGIGRYEVTVELPRAAGLYAGGNVTYRGTEVGRIKGVRLTDTGVAAVLSLKSGIDIPADLDAEVHSQSAVGEQYVALIPRRASRPLNNGDVITADRSSVPPDLDSLLDSANRGMESIPRDDLETVVDEAYTAVGGLGPELSRLVVGSSSLAIDARRNLDPLLTLIDESKPLLDSQTESSDAVQAWAGHLAEISEQLATNDASVRRVVRDGDTAAAEGQRLMEGLQPTLPTLLANMVSANQVAITYRPSLEQLLVLLPQAAATSQAIGVANRGTLQDYKGVFMNFDLRLNLPPPCTTGYLPAQQRRTPSLEDHPDRPAGDLYCRVPQDSMQNVRGVRNTPCVTRPGKRAPTVTMCESDESYVPLNDGYNWKGDPNATLSGQPVPQLPHGQEPALSAPVPIGAAAYDPATGDFMGPDGRVYSQSDLAAGSSAEPKSWQSMLLPEG